MSAPAAPSDACSSDGVVSASHDDANRVAAHEPVSIAFAVGNTYRRLDPSEASYDKRTGRHLKIHDWTLYVDVLPGTGQDPDVIDRVTFDMRDDSFVTSSFTCHCPIRIRADAGSSSIGQISGVDNQNNTQEQFGQPTKEEGKVKPPVSTRPQPSQSRWRFSTRQQTYGPVDVQISIRGRGGCRCTVMYKIVLTPGGNECPAGSLPPFIEKRPHQPLKPLKMMDSKFSVEMLFVLDYNAVANNTPSTSLYDAAKSAHSRSKLWIRLFNQNGYEDFTGNKQRFDATTKPWIVKLVQPSAASSGTFQQSADSPSSAGTSSTFSLSSPTLIGGNGLNDVYKIIEGLPQSTGPPASLSTNSIHVQIDVSTLSTEQIVKVCQNFVKYEEAIDSFMPLDRKDNRCNNCKSNKQSVEGDTNKQRNENISKCNTLEELVDFLNPVIAQQYKLNVRTLLRNAADVNDASPSYHHSNKAIEFRQHPSSKDKTTVTHWIRFCTAFVRNSARLRPPTALKATTSIEEEFDMLFEYVVKDRALRNYYRERRDAMNLEEEEMRNEQLREMASKQPLSTKNSDSVSASFDSMSISSSSDEPSPLLHTTRKRSNSTSEPESGKRACL